ncbi:hypothetical protein KY360_00505 [Candidatus Woesearchaeota archaeon]|nr:hypothetical protein [Candidatus Woesearchaeota archaeon]
MRLRNITAKKKGSIKLEDLPFLLLYVMITIFAVILMGSKAYLIIGDHLKLHNLPHYQLDSRLLSRFSVPGSPGTIDMDKFNEDYLMKIIDRSEYSELTKKYLAIELILINSKTGDSEIIYYDQETYERLKPVAKFRFAIVDKIHPCSIMVGDAKERCIFKVNIIASKI